MDRAAVRFSFPWPYLSLLEQRWRCIRFLERKWGIPLVILAVLDLSFQVVCGACIIRRMCSVELLWGAFAAWGADEGL